MNGLQEITLDQVLPFTKVRTKLSSLVKQLPSKEYFVISQSYKPKAALVDIKFFLSLLQAKKREEAFQKLRLLQENLGKATEKYLTKKGVKLDALSDADLLKLVDKDFENVFTFRDKQ